MKQVIQNYRTGKLELAEVPVPLCSADRVLVRTAASLISVGTERSILDLGKKSLLGKARARPDLVKRFVEKARNEGLMKTFKEAMDRLDNPTSLGYSSSGVVVEVGRNIHDISVGDRVACIGSGYASHAEYVSVPANLCCRLPDSVPFEEGSFGMLGIIAMHGIRSAELTFGAPVAVVGLGLLGLISVQLLKAYGCRVYGFDIDPRKVKLAADLGADRAFQAADELRKGVEQLTEGHGVDAVVITAATRSDEPVNLGVELCKPRGRIVLVGVADIHPQRNEMWHKEVEIVVSRAGGPGVFDPVYENKGIDYPLGLVRWTEKRNLQEFLRLVSEGRVDMGRLVTHRFPIAEALAAYAGFDGEAGREYVGVVLEYPSRPDPAGEGKRTMALTARGPARPDKDSVGVGVIGAGLFGRAVLLPALSRVKGVRLAAVATSSSANAQHIGSKYGFAACSTDYKALIADPGVDALVILTPHSLHSRMVCEGLAAGKHVFVEKPLCVTHAQLAEVREAWGAAAERGGAAPLLVAGYSRRHSPHAERMREFLAGRREPMVINYRVNAGFVPADHWVHSEEQGGGRIVGEMCHFVDLMQYLTGSEPERIYAERISGNNATMVNNDNVILTLRFRDGSVAGITYSASGDRSMPREQIEVFCERKSLVSTDFRRTAFYMGGKETVFKTSSQDMGYHAELDRFIRAAAGKGEPGLTPDEIFLSTEAVLKAHDSLSTGVPAAIGGVPAADAEVEKILRMTGIQKPENARIAP